jgi:holo-[acyl-carrier protein] synthase
MTQVLENTEDPRHFVRDDLRVGIDVASAADVAASIERFGDRYLERLFTEHELESCCGQPAGLAARFAAKEATLKVLRDFVEQPPWRSIEVYRHPQGSTELRLVGPAERLANEAGITSLAVSLTHDGDVAAAIVVALCGKAVQ